MSVNKYSKRKNNSSNDYDILGIILIIISAFLLLCSIIPVIFGIISEALRSVLLGIFGISTYAILSFTLAVGICLLLNRKIAVSGSRVALILGMAVSLLLILQLITTNDLLEKSFGEYLAEVYARKYTAGGLFLGFFAYAVKAIVQFATIAYVLFALIFLTCGALLGYGIYKQYLKNQNGGAKSVSPEAVAVEKETKSRPLFTDDLPLQRVQMHAPT
ncbi:MAG: hypothetical protein IJX05_03275, partial [Clostridia bacterium]|nr:hypothetical protein [Clostridia bacterium]